MAGLAGEVVSHVIAGGVLGWLVDRWLGTDLWVMIGLLAGIATGLLAMIKSALKLHRQLDAPTRPKNPSQASQEGSGRTQEPQS